MVKKRIIVKGNVQGIGYRALVKLIARSLVVKGRIRNLDDGTVEMFCEGEVGVLARFLSTIDIKRRNGNLLAIDVKEMEEHQEGTDGYGKGTAPREFKAFEIDHGQDLTLADQEMLERQELLIVGGSQVLDGLGIVGEKVDIVGQKVDIVGQKVDKGFSELGHKVDGVGKNVKDLGEKVNVVGHNVIGMHGDMNEKFMKMEKKYHMINENIERSNKNVEKMIKDNARTNENLRRLIEKGDKVDRNIARMNKSLEMTSRALVKLIEKDIVERRKARTAKKKR